MRLRHVLPLWMTTGPPPTILTTYPFRSQSTPNLTNSLLIPVGRYMYSITYLLILITSPTAILNSPINSFCPLDTALVLTSDDFRSIFLLSHHSSPFLSCILSDGSFPKLSPVAVFTVCLHTFTRQNISIKLPCICVCLSSRNFFIFSVRVSSFFSYFCVIRSSMVRIHALPRKST